MHSPRKHRIAALVASAALAVVAAEAPADARVTGSVRFGANYASSNGTWVEVCDMESDGHGVYGIFDTNTGTARVNDGNGSAGGCGNATFGRVDRFRVCEDRPYAADPCSSIATP